MSCPAAGYQGYLLACGSLLPYLSSDLVKVTGIIQSPSVHGGGLNGINPVFRSETNIAIGQQIVEGGVNVEVFAGTGNYATAFRNVLNRAIPTQTDYTTVCNGFNSSCYLIFNPGGLYELKIPAAGAAQGKAMVTQLELKGNNGGNVQANFRIIGSGADQNNAATNAPSVSALAFEAVGNTDDSNPLPYYASNFTVTNSGETGLADRIMDWNITINNSCTPIFAFDGKNYAQDIVLGMCYVTGSFTYYSPTGTFVDPLTNGATCTISFGTTTLNLPYLAFGRSPVPSPGPNNPTIRTVEFRGLAASTTTPSIYLS